MMCRGDNREQLQAIIDSEFILQQLTCSEQIDDGVRLLQRAGLATSSNLDGWPTAKTTEAGKQPTKKNKKRRKKKKQSEACSS